MHCQLGQTNITINTSDEVLISLFSGQILEENSESQNIKDFEVLDLLHTG